MSKLTKGRVYQTKSQTKSEDSSSPPQIIYTYPKTDQPALAEPHNSIEEFKFEDIGTPYFHKALATAFEKATEFIQTEHAQIQAAHST